MDLPDGTGLSVLFVNCTLTPSPGESHTQVLIDRALWLVRQTGATADSVRAVDLELAPGVDADMTEHGAERDDWPALSKRVLASDVLVLGTPIWLGEKSSVCQRVIERLYALSGELNDLGQSVFYGRSGGVLVTGNEDGIKHVAMGVLYSLQHVGFTVPPQADAGWIGEAGPGASYGDGDPPTGFDNDFTNHNTTIMVANLLNMARLLRDAGGFPNAGNDRRQWEDSPIQLPDTSPGEG